MIYVNQSWKKKKFTSMLNYLFIISSKEVWNTDDPYTPPQLGEKKKRYTSLQWQKRSSETLMQCMVSMLPSLLPKNMTSPHWNNKLWKKCQQHDHLECPTIYLPKVYQKLPKQVPKHQKWIFFPILNYFTFFITHEMSTWLVFSSIQSYSTAVQAAYPDRQWVNRSADMTQRCLQPHFILPGYTLCLQNCLIWVLQEPCIF